MDFSFSAPAARLFGWIKAAVLLIALLFGFSVAAPAEDFPPGMCFPPPCDVSPPPPSGLEKTVVSISAPNDAEVGVTAPMLVTVTNSDSTTLAGAPEGSVQLYIDDVPYGPATPIQFGFTSIDVVFDAAGPKIIRADYAGDQIHEPSSGKQPIVVFAPREDATVAISSNSPSDAATDVTFTFTVAGTSTPANGSIDVLLDYSRELTLPLVNGAATYTAKAGTIDELSSGNHQILATYHGSATHRFSSANHTHTVNEPPGIETDLTLTSSKNPSAPGEDVTFTATVANVSAGYAFGTVSFYNGRTLVGFASLSQGKASRTVSDLGTGSHTISAVFESSGYATSSDQITQVVESSDLATTLDLSSSSNPSTVGDAVTFTATVRDASDIPAVGTVTFFDDKTEIGSAPLTNGVAKLQATDLTEGTHPIYAAFKGDGYTGSSSSLSQEVDPVPLESTTTTVTAEDVWAGYDVPISFEVKGSKSTPAGSIDVTIDSGTSFSLPLVDGKATYAASALGVGRHTVSATYGGGSKHANSSGQARPEVFAKKVNIYFLGLDPIMSLGQRQSFEVNLGESRSGIPPTGSVTLTDNGVLIETKTVTSGYVDFDWTPSAAGRHFIEAKYTGADGFESDSETDTVSVTTSTSIELTAINDNAAPGETVTLRATVINPGTGYAQGSVTFKEGSTTLGSSTVNNGVAELAVNSLADGQHLIEANFSDSDGSFGDSSGTTTVTIVTPVKLSITPVALDKGIVGQSVDAMFSVTGGSGVYSFSATGLPSGVTLSENGHLTGKPTVANMFTVEVSASEGGKVVAQITIPWTVDPAPALKTRIEITGGETGVKVGDTVTFTATVLTDANVLVTAGEVVFSIGGVNPQPQFVPVKDGTAKYTATVPTRLGALISARYSDRSGTYQAASQQYDVKVSHGQSRIELTGPRDVAVGQEVTYTAKVLGGSMPLRKGTVSFQALNGNPPTGTVQFNGGDATFTTKFAFSGSTKLLARFDETSDYERSGAELEISVLPAATPNTAPTITVFGTKAIPENTMLVMDIDATDDVDKEGSGLTYSIGGGRDRALFSIDSASGVLSFKSGPDFEAPADHDGDNEYDIEVMVFDSGVLGDSREVTVIVTDVDEAPPVPTRAATALTIVPSANPSANGSTVRFAITVASEGGTPEGDVALNVDGQTTTLTLSGGSATYEAALSAGSYPVTATYESTENFEGSSASITQSVTGGVAKRPSYTNAKLVTKEKNKAIQVSIKVKGSGGGTPTGRVEVSIDGRLTTGRLSDGKVTLKSSIKLKGGETIKITYLGDVNFRPSTDMLKGRVRVEDKDPELTFNVTPSVSGPGDIVKLRADVAYDGVPLVGSIEFLGEGLPGGRVPVTDGQASVQFAAPVAGTYEYLAEFYPDDETFDTVWASAEITVAAAPVPVVSVVTSPSPSLPGEAVTVTVSSTEMTGPIHLTVREHYMYGQSRPLDGELVDGKATFAITFDASGTYPISGTVGGAQIEGVTHEVESASEQSFWYITNAQQQAMETSLDLFDNPDMSVELDPPDDLDGGLAFFPDRLALNASLWAIQEAAGAQKRGAFNFWLGARAGTISSSDANGWTVSGALGGDYMFSPQLIGGLGLMFDRVTLEDRNGTDTIGNGWIATPYLKGNITDSLAYKLQAGYGRVTNEVTPNGATYTDVVNGDRKLLSGSLVGTIQVGDYTINPSGSVTYFDQTMEAFTDGQGNTIPSLSMGTVTMSLSPAISRRFDLDGMALTLGGNLKIAVSAENDRSGWAFGGLRDGAGVSLSLALPGGATFRADAGIGGVVLGDTFTTRGSIGLSANLN